MNLAQLPPDDIARIRVLNDVYKLQIATDFKRLNLFDLAKHPQLATDLKRFCCYLLQRMPYGEYLVATLCNTICLNLFAHYRGYTSKASKGNIEELQQKILLRNFGYKLLYNLGSTELIEQVCQLTTVTREQQVRELLFCQSYYEQTGIEYDQFLLQVLQDLLSLQYDTSENSRQTKGVSSRQAQKVLLDVNILLKTYFFILTQSSRLTADIFRAITLHGVFHTSSDASVVKPSFAQIKALSEFYLFHQDQDVLPSSVLKPAQLEVLLEAIQDFAANGYCGNKNICRKIHSCCVQFVSNKELTQIQAQLAVSNTPILQLKNHELKAVALQVLAQSQQQYQALPGLISITYSNHPQKLNELITKTLALKLADVSEINPISYKDQATTITTSRNAITATSTMASQRKILVAMQQQVYWYLIRVFGYVGNDLCSRNLITSPVSSNDTHNTKRITQTGLFAVDLAKSTTATTTTKVSTTRKFLACSFDKRISKLSEYQTLQLLLQHDDQPVAVGQEIRDLLALEPNSLLSASHNSNCINVALKSFAAPISCATDTMSSKQVMRDDKSLELYASHPMLLPTSHVPTQLLQILHHNNPDLMLATTARYSLDFVSTYHALNPVFKLYE